MAQNADRTEPQELFEIELAKIVRESETPFGDETYDVTFDCRRSNETVEATIEIETDTVTTIEIVPRAMSDLHVLFTDLAEQTKAWFIEGK